MAREYIPKVGDKVYIRSERRRTRIDVVLKGIPGGVMINPAVNGSRYWNADDMRLLERPHKRKAPHAR